MEEIWPNSWLMRKIIDYAGNVKRGVHFMKCDVTAK